MKTSATLLALALSLSALTTIAQDSGDRPAGPPPGGPRGGGMRSPLIAALDVNKDGKIDASEIAGATTALAKLDKNSDGQISKDELQPVRPEGAPDGGPGGEGRPGPGGPGSPGGPGGQGGPGGRGGFAPPVVTALDANKDGTIGVDELKNAATALKTLDKNSDGELTQDELRGPRPGGEGRRRPQPPKEQ